MATAKDMLFSPLRHLRDEMNLPRAARESRKLDSKGLPMSDPGLDEVINACITWLCRAQDKSLSADDGAARNYSLINGWSSSYPETSGYIVPTLLDYADEFANAEVRERGKRMLDWLVSIQFPEGGFQGGKIDQQPRVPVTFNTGQILIGLAAGARRWEAYMEPTKRAASWLTDTLDEDGSWRSHPTPFAEPGEKAYETHVSWGLLEAAKVAPGHGYEDAGLANIRWAISHQKPNGWVAKCCLDRPDAPLTHTLGYFLRGVIEGYLFTNDTALLDAALKTADGLLNAIDTEGRLPGRLDSDWQGAVEWVCLTGSVQIAHCWLLLWQITGDERYKQAGFNANRYVRRAIDVNGQKDIRGGVKGSFPVDGQYGKYQYLNWAAKFCTDSQMLERKIRTSE